MGAPMEAETNGKRQRAMSASRESEEHFSLQWNNFHSNLSEGFHLLQKAEDLVDVTLAAGSKYVQAHRLVLSVCSPYFKELFRVNPCKHPTVILKDVSFQELVDILEFMYCGQVNVQQDRLSEFLKTAEMLQVKGLSEDDTSVNPLLANMSSSAPVQAPAKKSPTPIIQKKLEFKESTSAQYNEASSPPVKRKRRATQPEMYSAPPSFNEELVVVSKPYNDDTSDEVELINIIEPKEEVNLEDDESNVEEGETNQDGKPSFSNIFNDDNGFPGQNISDSQFELDFPSNSQTVVGVHGVNEGSPIFVQSARGYHHLVFKGFRYRRDYMNANKVFWKCLFCTKTKCRARLITVDSTVFVKHAEHNHDFF
ncbi:GDNF-inducible zinc finger protein 1-like isoform X8 [Bacillus rossius redtenbacheri]|uniref:GDNF-inducible zinc finger protein 1-like isoform X8 n=1 Tax=Bacillus rossius redtenbacheri TaxID=93214 RepID=UPI002FDE32C2